MVFSVLRLVVVAISRQKRKFFALNHNLEKSGACMQENFFLMQKIFKRMVFDLFVVFNLNCMYNIITQIRGLYESGKIE